MTENSRLHVAIIMDGNRRFAKRLMKHKAEGHRHGAKKLKEVLRWCKEENVGELTVFAFSRQNTSRPQEEFDYLMDVTRSMVNDMSSKKGEIQRLGIRVRFAGNMGIFPQDVQESALKIVEDTKENTSYTLNICFGYGGREEITDAVRLITRDVSQGKLSADDIDEATIRSRLDIASEPDIIIRTGGEIRLSNFLLWQCAYSELFFVDTMWPEFSKQEFLNILGDFKQRDRRFGS